MKEEYTDENYESVEEHMETERPHVIYIYIYIYIYIPYIYIYIYCIHTYM